MKIIYWILGVIAIIAFTIVNLTIDIPITYRLLNPLLLAAFLCLIRIAFGPTPADRAVGIDILGILIIGFCGILSVFTMQSFFIDIAIAWALQSFIATLALAKYLEGKSFDD